MRRDLSEVREGGIQVFVGIMFPVKRTNRKCNIEIPPQTHTGPRMILVRAESGLELVVLVITGNSSCIYVFNR